MLFKKNGDINRELHLPIVTRLKSQDYSGAETLSRAVLKRYPDSIRARYNLMVSLTKQSEILGEKSERITEAIQIFEDIINEDIILFLKNFENINDPIKYILKDIDLKYLYICSPGLKYQVLSYKKILEPEIRTKEYSRGGCFAGDMKILMANGKTKQIIELEIGDQVISQDAEKVLSTSVVTKKFKSTATPFILNGTIKVTASQPVLNRDKKWVNVKDIKIGDYLFSYSKGIIQVTNIELSQFEEDVFNLEITPDQNYVVQDIIAHNKLSMSDF